MAEILGRRTGPGRVRKSQQKNNFEGGRAHLAGPIPERSSGKAGRSGFPRACRGAGPEAATFAMQGRRGADTQAVAATEPTFPPPPRHPLTRFPGAVRRTTIPAGERPRTEAPGGTALGASRARSGSPGGRSPEQRLPGPPPGRDRATTATPSRPPTRSPRGRPACPFTRERRAPRWLPAAKTPLRARARSSTAPRHFRVQPRPRPAFPLPSPRRPPPPPPPRPRTRQPRAASLPPDSPQRGLAHVRALPLPRAP